MVYAGFGLACALSGTPLLYLGGAPGPSALGWAVVAMGSLAALACCAVGRWGLRPALRVMLWAICFACRSTDIHTAVQGHHAEARVA